MSLVSYADSDDSSDNEEKEKQLLRKPISKNDNVDDKKADCPDTTSDNKYFDGKTKLKSIGNLFSSLPAPWRSSVSWTSKDSSGKSEKKERRQTVKISLPIAEESDSDDETQEAGKRKHISQKHSGLSSLLPKPKHSIVVKENNPNRPMTKISNRPLIPDSLRRKQAKDVQPLPRHKNQVKKQDSDDEDQESVSFFSFTEQEPPVGKETTGGDCQDTKPVTGFGSEVWNSLYDTSPLNLNNTSTTANTSSADVDEKAKWEETNDTLISQPSCSNAAPDPYSVQHSVNVETPAENSYNFGEPTTTTYYSNAGLEPYYNYSYDQDNQNTPQVLQHGAQWLAEPTVHNTPDQTDCASDKLAINDDIQFKKLQGKRTRGEENIKIIDVNADDQVGSASEWKSRYQREDAAEHKPQSKKKGNMPSTQQRRKHQITYLAFQAKETEWELRNQWAANSQTRRQTQSRYGF